MNLTDTDRLAGLLVALACAVPLFILVWRNDRRR